MKKGFYQTVTDFLWSCLIFFSLVGGVVTATFYVFFSTVSLPEEDIRAFAPVVFVNVIVLSLICAIVDTIRRRVAVDRPARRIHEVLGRLAAGDFFGTYSATVRATLSPALWRDRAEYQQACRRAFGH